MYNFISHPITSSLLYYFVFICQQFMLTYIILLDLYSSFRICNYIFRCRLQVVCQSIDFERERTCRRRLRQSLSIL